jgi:hypothetical protein
VILETLLSVYDSRCSRLGKAMAKLGVSNEVDW